MIPDKDQMRIEIKEDARIAADNRSLAKYTDPYPAYYFVIYNDLNGDVLFDSTNFIEAIYLFDEGSCREVAEHYRDGYVTQKLKEIYG